MYVTLLLAVGVVSVMLPPWKRFQCDSRSSSSMALPSQLLSPHGPALFLLLKHDFATLSMPEDLEDASWAISLFPFVLSLVRALMPPIPAPQVPLSP